MGPLTIREMHKANQLILATMRGTSVRYYVCDACGEKVFDAELHIRSLDQTEKCKVGCKCWVKENEKIIDEAIKKSEQYHKQEKAKRLLQESKLGRRFMDCTFENFETCSEITELYTSFTEYLNNFEEHRNKGEGLFIRGSNGIGKTHLSAALVKELTARGYSCMFVLVPELLEDLRNTYEKTGQENGEPNIHSIDYMDKLQDVDLLILDDIGAEKPSQWAQERIFLTIDKRYRDMKPIIYTSNCGGEDLEKRLGYRAMSRIIGTSKIFSIQAQDYRGKNQRAGRG